MAEREQLINVLPDYKFHGKKTGGKKKRISRVVGSRSLGERDKSYANMCKQCRNKGEYQGSGCNYKRECGVFRDFNPLQLYGQSR